MNCIVSGSIVTVPEPGFNMYCGGVIGDNKNTGTVSSCTFEGDIIAAIVGGIVGGNSGTVSNCHKLSGSVIITTGDEEYAGGIIGYVFSSDVTITGNTFSKAATGQDWGIGYDPRQSPRGPSNNGATPIDIW
jgi:hypothetical protein